MSVFNVDLVYALYATDHVKDLMMKGCMRTIELPFAPYPELQLFLKGSPFPVVGTCQRT